MWSTLALVQSVGTAAVEVVCVFLVAMFLIVCCIPPLHRPLRALIRPWVIYHVEGGLDWVAYFQTFHTDWLTSLFFTSSHTVSVPFYVSTQPTPHRLSYGLCETKLMRFTAHCRAPSCPCSYGWVCPS